jgi:putative hydrolase of the HAD superfamily
MMPIRNRSLAPHVLEASAAGSAAVTKARRLVLLVMRSPPVNAPRSKANWQATLSDRYAEVLIMIKAVVFDLGGVIVPLDFPRGYRAIERLCPYEAGEIQRRIMSTGLVNRLETGQMEAREFASVISERLGLRLSFEEFADLWSSIFPPHTLVPESLLATLARRYRLLLLSNTNAIHFPYVQRNYTLLKHFHGFVLSYEVGVMKPDAAIYATAALRANCQPEECLFIDDLEENVEGARRTGMQSVRFDSVERLQKDLLARGIVCD